MSSRTSSAFPEEPEVVRESGVSYIHFVYIRLWYDGRLMTIHGRMEFKVASVVTMHANVRRLLTG